MPPTLGFTGMDPVTESALRSAFTIANTRVGGHWQLLPENQAGYVVVDMDSMYGPMSWLRLHASGKHVIGLTSGPRTQTDFRLARPFDSASVAVLLRQIGIPSSESGAAAATEPATIAEPVRPTGMTAAPQPQDQLPEEQPQAISEEVAPPAEPLAAIAPDLMVKAGVAGATTTATREPPSAAAARIVPAAPSIEPRAPAAPVPAQPPAKAIDNTLGGSPLIHWLAPGRLTGRVRFERNGPTLLIDADHRQYHGPAALKGLSGHFEGTITAQDFQVVDAGMWGAQAAALGDAQSMARLVWFGALLAGRGKLAAGFDPADRYQLLKWPQTEREFPKHFRIATAMMKGPATLAEIVEASGVPITDVIDFVNANLATGFAEPHREPEPDADPPKSGGLFGRLRGR